jgi:transposase
MQNEDKEPTPTPTPEQVPVKKRRGRPAYLTPEEKKERIKMYNAKRGPQRHIWRTCEICQKDLMSQNYNRHFLSQQHIKNSYIKKIESQLE